MVLAVAKASSAAGARLQVSSQKQALEHVHHTTGGVLSTTPWTKGNRHSQALSVCLVALRNKNTPGIVQFCGARRNSQVIHDPSRACFGVILSALLQLLL